VVQVDAATNAVRFAFDDDVKASVLNPIPPMRSGDIAVRAGNGQQALVRRGFPDPRVQRGPAYPCAAAVIALLEGKQPDALPLCNNACCSVVRHDEAMHSASVHRYDAAQRTLRTVSGPSSPRRRGDDNGRMHAVLQHHDRPVPALMAPCRAG